MNKIISLNVSCKTYVHEYMFCLKKGSQQTWNRTLRASFVPFDELISTNPSLYLRNLIESPCRKYFITEMSALFSHMNRPSEFLLFWTVSKNWMCTLSPSILLSKSYLVVYIYILESVSWPVHVYLIAVTQWRCLLSHWAFLFGV